MNASSFRSNGRSGRKSAQRPLRRKVIVVCEGAKTEPTYLGDLERRASGVRAFQLKVVPCTEAGGTCPRVLVRDAKDRLAALRIEERKLAKETRGAVPAGEVWCVFDRDQHEHFTEACNLAEGCGVQLAVSNPCFELWVLLHFEYRNTAVHRHDVQRILADKAYIPAYDKAMPGLFAALEDRMAAATRHAEQLRAAHAAVAALPRSNPSSDVDLLLKSLGVVK